MVEGQTPLSARIGCVVRVCLCPTTTPLILVLPHPYHGLFGSCSPIGSPLDIHVLGKREKEAQNRRGNLVLQDGCREGSRDIHLQDGVGTKCYESAAVGFSYCELWKLSHERRAHRTVDTNRLVSCDAVDASLSSGVPYGPDRQQETGPHGAHEVRLLSEARGRKP